jgi:prepilin-type N-terminal cleavage/methylation domain-containing protein
MIQLDTKRKAFTMIELVFAIVAIGILASLAMPRISRDLINEASTNILADIRYTQHLALMDNKHMLDNPRWQRRWWKIGFEKCPTGIFETVSSDTNMGGQINQGEEALDPSNGLPMDIPNSICTTAGHNKRMLLTKSYGITAVVFGGGCATAPAHLAFDYLGRPHQGITNSLQPDYASYLDDDCTLTFTMSTDADEDGTSDTFSIRITAETGHTFIVGQPDS